MLARRAGERLLEEFHRPGGPRHKGARHADVDDEVEDLLREELERAFPDDGFKGEESTPRGLNRLSRSGRTWVVDPNDGTSAFIRGRRGSAVSIALITGGRPVLGVVFSPTSPDDRGDLFAWAEGEPFCRNGVQVSRAPLPATLGPYAVVLASNSAERHATANARAIAPASPISNAGPADEADREVAQAVMATSPALRAARRIGRRKELGIGLVT